MAVNVLQTGFLFLPQRVSFDLGRISPIRGWQRIFSSAGMVHLGFGLLKLTAVFAVAGVVLYNQREALLGLIALPPPALAAQMAQILLWTALKIGAALLVLAILDYAYQRWRHEQDLKMTPQELREELKNLEGDPQLTARRKQMQHATWPLSGSASSPTAGGNASRRAQAMIASCTASPRTCSPVGLLIRTGLFSPHLIRESVLQFPGQGAGIELHDERESFVLDVLGHSTRGLAEPASAKAGCRRIQGLPAQGRQADLRAGMPRG